MNFYICSTVRHFLFALLKALSEPDETHHILFFSDFQATSLDAWDLSELPENTRVHEGNRREFRNHLNRTLRGKAFYFLALRNLIAPAFLQQAFFDTLTHLHPAIAQSYREARPRNLWLFNERNKMARVFRLVSQDFFLIEEGSGNYHYFTKSFWRWPGRILLGRPFNKLSFGEDRRCRKILVSYPDKVPPYVRAKAEKLTFLDTPDSKQKIRKMFADTIDFGATSGAVFVATSPLDEFDDINKKQKLALYQCIVATLKSIGFASVLKLHPRENPRDYDAMADSIYIVPEKLPLEVIILLSDEPVTILSFFTSAGIGLEPYFNLVELCDRSDSEGYEIKKLYEWIEHPDRLKALVASRMAR